MLRYASRSIFGLMETEPGLSMWNPFNATDVDNYNKVLRKLLYDLKNQAATGDSMKKYATSNVTGNINIKVNWKILAIVFVFKY